MVLNANKPEKEKSKAITESEVQKNKEKKVEEIFYCIFLGISFLLLFLKRWRQRWR